VTGARQFLRSNGLTLAFFGIFLAALFGESVVGVADYNQHQLVQGAETVSYVHYLLSSSFAVDVAENWQSEYLQFLLYIVATVWLVQRGSPESKELGKEGTESDEEQKVGEYADEDSPALARVRGFRGFVYSRSLGLLMGAIFLLSWLAQSVAGTAAYNSDQIQQLQDPVTWWGYTSSPDFWSRTLQNWQSEFLAVASMCAFSIYLRQRGSSESKPVGAAHAATGIEG